MSSNNKAIDVDGILCFHDKQNTVLNKMELQLKQLSKVVANQPKVILACTKFKLRKIEQINMKNSQNHSQERGAMVSETTRDVLK